MTVIEVRRVHVELDGHRVVADVSLTLERGEWVSLLGPNGAGKTTLLRVVAGTRPFTGNVRVAGCDVATASRRTVARLVALVPQVPVVPAAMSVGDYVLLGRTPHIGVLAREGEEDRQAAAGALERLELLEVARRPLGTLSGGELQRAILARALAQQAPVLLLDEPTTALDIGHQQQALDLVDELRRETGLTVLAALHELTLAAQYGDRVALMDAGSIVAEGSARDVVTERRIADLFGARVRVVDAEGTLAVVPARMR